MLLDYVNSLLEFIMVLDFFLIFSEEKLQIKSLIIYACCAFLCSLYFVQPFSGILFINAPLFLLSVCISFRDEPFFHRLFAAGTAFLCTIILEFTTLSFIPVSLLQTYLGSLISNLAILIPLMVILLFVRKQHLNSVLSVFVWRFRFILSCVLIIFLFLGQFYLSRLSAVWSHLPGIIAFCVLLVLIFSMVIYIRYLHSRDHLQAALFDQYNERSQQLLETLRIKEHDAKHHIHHLQDLIRSASDIDTLRQETALYLHDLEAGNKTFELLMGIERSALRTFLFGCSEDCQQEKIRFEIRSTGLLPDFPLKDYQLVEVLENLFMNAVEHNRTVPEDNRYIIITLSSENDVQMISFDNPLNRQTMNLQDMYLLGKTSKEDPHHGMGLSSIQKTLTASGMRLTGTIHADSITFSINYKKEQVDEKNSNY